MAEKIVDGWRKAEKRNDTNLLHHLIIPWSELSEEKRKEKAKDFDFVAMALDLTPEEKCRFEKFQNSMS